MLKKIRTREFWFQVLKQLICITMVIIVVLPILLTLFCVAEKQGRYGHDLAAGAAVF